MRGGSARVRVEASILAVVVVDAAKLDLLGVNGANQRNDSVWLLLSASGAVYARILMGYESN